MLTLTILRRAASRVAAMACIAFYAALGAVAAARVHVGLKPEAAQHNGGVKLRGATNALLPLSVVQLARVATYATGYNGCAFAHRA